MKSLQRYVNEGLFSRKKKANSLNIPDEMPKKYVEFFQKYFWEDVDRGDVKNEKDVEEYLLLVCDEFWDMVVADYKWNPYKHGDNLEEDVLSKWKHQIVKIALK